MAMPESKGTLGSLGADTAEGDSAASVGGSSTARVLPS